MFSPQLSAGFGDGVVPSSLLMVFSMGSHLLSCLVTFFIAARFLYYKCFELCYGIQLSYVEKFVVFGLDFKICDARPGHCSV